MASSSSSTNPSTESTQPSQAASTMPSSVGRNSDTMNAAVSQINEQSDDTSPPTDPSERSTGVAAEIMNKSSEPGRTRSVHKALMEYHHPDALEYYEQRRTGKVEGKSFEEWGDEICEKRAKKLDNILNSTVQHAFFPMDYSHGFTGRGVLPEAMERPCLVGPRNETVDERVGLSGASSYEQVDRPLWKASDAGNIGPSGELKDEGDDEDVGPLGESRDEEEEVGPLGESRDEEEVGPLGESRDGDDVRSQGHDDEEEVEEDLNDLVQLAATSVGIMSEVFTIMGNGSSAHATTSSPTFASTSLTPSRKRARTSEDDAEDEDSPSQQKKMRMDDALGIIRNNADTAKVQQIVGGAVTPVTQRSRKRGRSLEDDSEHKEAKPTRKRLRLYQRIKEIPDDEEEYVTACQTDDKAKQCEDISADDEAAPTEPDWDTAHGINSKGANVRIKGLKVHDINGAKTRLYLPTSTGLPDRPWTEGEKEDLRAYIQDYGIESWTPLSRSTNRPKAELQRMYLEIVTSRNLQAGRPERDGILEDYPNLVPPQPPASTAPPAPEERPKLRPRDRIGKTKKNNLGDLTYDLKATSFPKITKDGGMVDSKGNALLGIMSDISCATKGRQAKLKQQKSMSLPCVEKECNNERSQAYGEAGEAGIEEGEIVEGERTLEQGQSPETTGRKVASLNAGMEEYDDPDIKQEDQDQELQAPNLTAPAAQVNSAKGPLCPRSAGTPRLSGSSRRGVPRNAAGLRK